MKYVLNLCLTWNEIKVFALSNGHDKEVLKKVKTLDKFFVKCQKRLDQRKPCLYEIKYT